RGDQPAVREVPRQLMSMERGGGLKLRRGPSTTEYTTLRIVPQARAPLPPPEGYDRRRARERDRCGQGCPPSRSVLSPRPARQAPRGKAKVCSNRIGPRSRRIRDRHLESVGVRHRESDRSPGKRSGPIVQGDPRRLRLLRERRDILIGLEVKAHSHAFHPVAALPKIVLRDPQAYPSSLDNDAPEHASVLHLLLDRKS